MSGRRVKVVAVALVVLYASVMVVWLGGGARPSGAALVPDPCRAEPALGPGDTLRLVTWNVHYGAGTNEARGRTASRQETQDNLDRVATAIRGWRPHLVVLQELDRHAWRSHWIDAFEHLQRALEMPCGAWTRTWNAGWVPWPPWPHRQIGRVRSGQGVLSQLPLSAPVRTTLPQPSGRWLRNRFALHRALLEVRVGLEDGSTLTLVNAHLESFDAGNRVEQARILAERAAAAGPRVVVAGDLNGPPDGPAVAALHGVRGMRGVLPAGAWQAGPPTMPTFPATDPQAQLDYVFFGEGLELVTARAPLLTASDHLPLLVELRIRPEPSTLK